MQEFRSINDISGHNNTEDCYVAFQDMVFDITSTLNEMDFLKADSCGKDITRTLGIDNEMLFLDINQPNLLGVIVGGGDEPVVENADAEIEENVVDEENVIILNGDDVREETTQGGVVDLDTSNAVSPESVLMVGGILIAIIVLLAALTYFLKHKKGKAKKVEVKKTEVKKPEEKAKK
jgi:hypothetical protein